MQSKPLILCPLEIERRAAARTARDRADVICTGPGPDRMRDALLNSDLSSRPCAILYGVAGGLRHTETSPTIAAVVDERAQIKWTSPMLPKGEGLTIVGVDDPAFTIERKAELLNLSDADLVDTESHVFAPECDAAHIPWAVIRGVSDGPETVLLPIMGTWVDEHGKTKTSRVMRDLARRPSLIPRVAEIGSGTRRALASAARVLDALLTEHAATIRDA